MAELLTVSGDVLMLDDEDVPLFQGKRLYTLRTRKLTYATYVVKVAGKQRSVLAHRRIMDAPVGSKIDHINGNGLDCRRQNLRFATEAQNQANRRADSVGASRFKGVAHGNVPDSWRAAIKVSGETVYLGWFKDEQVAARVYDRAALEAWGTFARLNFPNLLPIADAEVDAYRRTIARGRSKYRGVHWDPKYKKWKAEAMIDGKALHFGRFMTETDAAHVVDAMVWRAGCSRLRLNFPDATESEHVAAEALRESVYLANRGSTSPYRGVSWNSKAEMWVANITINRKTKYLGRFSLSEDAARAYDAAVTQFGCNPAWLNFPPAAEST